MDIYIGNLPYDSDEQTVREAFEEHGNIDNVKIVIDQYTGRSKGFGFVTMSDWKEAQAAINALDGTSMGGRTIKVNQARQREERPRGDRGGDRGGGRGDSRRRRY
jgi:RNA recognition motif-containing protein